METQLTVLEARHVFKRFGGIEALKDVNLTLYEGEVRALLGENGAGKSTLIKILTGVEQKDQGEIVLHGKSVRISDPVSARQQGIAAIYQELSLIEHLTVAQNIFLGHEPTYRLGWNDNRKLYRTARQYLDQFGIDINPRSKVRDLGLGQKRIVEIVKALTIDARILFLDEPTTGMSQVEIERLFEIMQELKAHRVTMLYISHHLDEVFRVCDRAVVLRDGANAGDFDVREINKSVLVRAMIGRDVPAHVPAPALSSDPSRKLLLEAAEFQAEGMRAPLSFSLAAGEILGVTGIIGAGKTELGSALFGASKRQAGTLRINGQDVDLRGPNDARNRGIAFVPEDRKHQGLILSHSVANNITLPYLDEVTVGRIFLIGPKKYHVATQLAERVRVVPLNVKMPARNLSGGNQQKVVIGKWLLGRASVLILDEPTRGVDVGAKAEIYALIKSLAAAGAGVLVLSSEFEEINQLCDRVLVLRQGEIVGELPGHDASADRLLAVALGG